MLSIFIPQDTLEDILIDNMASDMEPEDQDVWFKIFTKQQVIYVSSFDEQKYHSEDDPLFNLSDSYGVEIRYETAYIEAIPDNHKLVTKYWNGIFLLDISEEDAAEIQKDYGVICQSIAHMDASILMDPGLRYSVGKDSEDYSWKLILSNINAKHYPSNHLTLIDRYLLARDKDKDKEEDWNFTMENIFNIFDVMLPVDKLKCPYTITLIVGEQKEGKSFSLSEFSKVVNDELIPKLNRAYKIDVEIIYLRYLSGLYTATHNRCILTNYTVTQLEHMTKAFDGIKSTCMQTITPQGLFTPSGLNDYCDSPYKTHDDVMTAIYKNLVWWVNNYLTTKNIYTLNGKTINIKDRYRVQKKGKYWLLINSSLSSMHI